MIPTVRRLRRGGTSLLAAAVLVTGCSGSRSDQPEGDPEQDDTTAQDTADGTAADGTATNDVAADGGVAGDREMDGPADTDEGHAANDDAADGEGTAGDQLPRFVTQDTPDGRYTMSVDDSATLELPQGTASPAVTGTAVEVFDVAFLADSGVAQWEIRAIEPGESTITTTVDGRSHTWTVAVD